MSSTTFGVYLTSGTTYLKLTQNGDCLDLKARIRPTLSHRSCGLPVFLPCGLRSGAPTISSDFHLPWGLAGCCCHHDRCFASHCCHCCGLGSACCALVLSRPPIAASCRVVLHRVRTISSEVAVERLRGVVKMASHAIFQYNVLVIDIDNTTFELI